jgi:hypothetical protein
MYGLKPVPFSPLQNSTNSSPQKPYDENDEPQPQERVEFGLIKLNP